MKKYEENEGSASEILRADYEKLLGEKQNLEKLVHDLTTSASWRLTKPLRTLLSIKRSAWPWLPSSDGVLRAAKCMTLKKQLRILL